MPGSFADAYIEQPGGGDNVPNTRTVNVTPPITGGGQLNADITIGIDPDYVRARLTTATDFYVRTDGNDANDGLANTPARAFQTISGGVFKIYTTYDLNAQIVTLHVADGTYNESVTITDFVGPGGLFKLVGNDAAPGNVIINPPAFNAAFFVSGLNSTSMDISGFKVSAPSDNAISIFSSVALIGLGPMEFGNTPNGACIHLSGRTYVYNWGNITVSGSSQAFIDAEDYALFLPDVGTTITLTGTPDFSRAFLISFGHSQVGFAGKTVTGAATGVRFNVNDNSSITTNTSGLPDLTFFPGSAPGVWQQDGSYNGIINQPLTTLGDVLYEDATPKPTRLAGNTTTTLKFLSQIGNGTVSAAPSWEVAPVNGLLTYMFIDAASVGTGVGYKQAVDLGHFTPATKASVTAAGATTGTIIASFATNVGFPNLNLMPDGLFHIHIHAKKGAAGQGTIHGDIYQRTSGGVENLITTTESSPALTSSEVEYDIHAVTGSAFPLNVTDRIVVKFVANVTSGTPDITIYYDGIGIDQTSSRVELPGPAIDSANFVPSTRAVNVTAPITGGGALSADITIGLDPTSIRVKLTGNKTYYVRTDGSDSNDGSANDAAHAWLTPQHAIDYLKSSVDCAGFDVTVNVADGTYSSADSIVAIQGEIPDIGQLKFTGNTTTPGNVVWSSTIDTIRLFGTYTSQRTLGINGFPHFEGMKLSSATRPAIYLEQAWMSYGHIEFSTVGASEAHIRVVRGSLAIPLADYTISAGAVAHLEADSYGYINYSSVALTVTLTGTPAFSVGFAYAHNDGQIFGANITFSGSATGPRYVAGTYGTITSTITFPGSLAGTTSIGGLYNNTPLTLSIPKADGSNDGYLSSGDWTTFNGKLDPATVSSQAYNGGDFTASGSMTWTVDAGDLTNFKYYINGKVMTIWFAITTSTVGGTASNTLLIKIPASKTANDLFTGIGRAFNGGAGFFVDMFTSASGTVINLRKVDGSNWTLETNATQVRGQITIEIQ